MKALPRAPKIWIWTSKIMHDLWLNAVFCQIKNKKLLPPSVQSYSPLYNSSYCNRAPSHTPLINTAWSQTWSDSGRLTITAGSFDRIKFVFQSPLLAFKCNTLQVGSVHKRKKLLKISQHCQFKMNNVTRLFFPLSTKKKLLRSFIYFLKFTVWSNFSI